MNQVTANGGTTISYGDSRGNITGIGSASYGYSSENLMTSAPNSVTMGYDPLTRLYQLADGSSTTRFAYDGANMIAEYDGSNSVTRRYVHGPGGQPLVWYQIGDSTPRRWLHADERGSIIAITNDSGTTIAAHNYDEYGNPQSGAIAGRFGYTGQAWLAEIGMWYYRARIYNSALGRFMQTDPIGYAGGMNLYAYVGGDPVNLTDPSGTSVGETCHPVTGQIVCGREGDGALCNSCSGSSTWDGTPGHQGTRPAGGGGGGGGAGGSPASYGGRSSTPELNDGATIRVTGMRQYQDRLGFSAADTLASLQVSSSCLAQPLCGGALPLRTAATLRALTRSPTFTTLVPIAWRLSNPYGSFENKREYGLWFGSERAGFPFLGLRIGYGPTTSNGYPVPAGGEIYVQMHPATRAEGYEPWFSRTDIGFANRNDILMILMSHNGLYVADYRE